MIEKYNAQKAAKDLGFAGKDIVALLGKYFPEAGIKPTTQLDELHLSVLFEFYTSERAVVNFDEMFKEAGARREQVAAELKEKAQAEAKAKEAAQPKAAPKAAPTAESSAPAKTKPADAPKTQKSSQPSRPQASRPQANPRRFSQPA